MGFLGAIYRVMDIVFSLTSLVMLFPLLLLIAISVKVTSPGPVFCRKERWGSNSQFFKMFKFRTMRIDAKQHTPLGTFLIKTKLDELPLLINVFMGNMSLRNLVEQGR